MKKRELVPDSPELPRTNNRSGRDQSRLTQVIDLGAQDRLVRFQTRLLGVEANLPEGGMTRCELSEVTPGSRVGPGR